VIRLANVEQRKTHEQAGAERGYRYESSPLICSESGLWPPDVKEVCIPACRPGGRPPHMWVVRSQPGSD